MYAKKFVLGFLASFSGLSLISFIVSYFSRSFAQTMPVIGNNPLLFHSLVVAPSEELMFRFFLPLLFMVFFGIDYILGGIVSAVFFGLAHFWAYQQNNAAMLTAVIAGGWQALIVYLFSDREDSFTFKPGLLCAILGHGVYNSLVTLAPELLLPAAIASASAFAGLYLLDVGRENL
ncbi:MAG: CPBP family glutamic-type intramembrane protease [Nitrososphaeria archaeon]